MKLLWKLKLDNQPRVMHSLFPPLVIERLLNNAGRAMRQIAIEAGSSDNIYAIDVEKGEVIWKKHFDSNSFTCRPRMAESGAPESFVREADGYAPCSIGPASASGKYTVYAVSWDGMLHRLDAANGEDVAPPARWMPPNGKPYALNLFDNVLYTSHRAELRR